jgi:hypothetical protein
LTRADRIDRLLLILALSYILLSGLGLVARGRYRPGMWSSSNDPQAFSVFSIGRAMLERMELSPAKAFAAVRQATAQVAPNWG